MTFPNSGTQFSAASFIKALSINPTSVLNLGSSQTYVDKFQASTLTAGGSHIRLTLQGNNSGTCTVSAVYIGNAASTGNAYNFDGSQVQVTFNSGSSTASIAAGSGNTLRSDTISFTLNTGNAILVAFQVATNSFFAYGASLGTKYVVYHHLANESASTVKSGSYTASAGQSILISLIEVY